MDATRVENPDLLKPATERKISHELTNAVRTPEQPTENKEKSLTELERVEKLENELKLLDSKTSEIGKQEEKQHIRNDHIEQRPTLKPLGRLRNNLLQPSTSFLRKTLPVPLGALAVTMSANFAGAPSELYGLTILVAAVLNGGYLAEYIRAYKETNKITDLMKLCKVASPINKIFQDGTAIGKGELVGELHMEGANVRKEWKKMSRFHRGKAMAQAGLDSLMQLAQLCKADAENVKGMPAFYGTSDIIRPEFMKKIGFEVEEADGNMLTRFGIKKKRIKALGIIDGLRTPVGKFYEAWITRDALIKSVPKIEHYREVLMNR